MWNKDWKWNTQSVMATLNASSHSEWDRAELDYYATPPFAVEKLLEKETFNNKILEPACWEGHISKVLIEKWYNVESSDIIYRGFPENGKSVGDNWVDFLNNQNSFNWDIITNPPYAMSTEFIEKSLEIIPEWNKIAMLLRVQFLESVKRYDKLFSKWGLLKMYVFSRNIRCAKNWDFENATGNASTYCWFIFQKWYKWDATIGWII